MDIDAEGSGFTPVPGQTSVRLNQVPVLPTLLRDERITFALPPMAASGKLMVSTPYGVAISDQDLLVAPTGVEPAAIESMKRLGIDAAAQTLSVAEAGKSLAVLFDGDAGDRLSLQFGGLGDVSVGYRLFDIGNAEILSGTVSASSATAFLPRLATPGTYLLLLKPNAYPATWSLGIERDKLLPVDGAPLPLAVMPGQTRRAWFAAEAGGKLGIGIVDVVTKGNNSGFNVNVYSQDRASIASASCSVSRLNCDLEVTTPAKGEYVVEIRSGNSAQSVALNVLLSSEVRNTLTRDVAMPLEIVRRGQNARLSFAGEAGERLTLRVMEQITTPGWQTVYYHVLKPDGTILTSTSLTSPGTLEIPILPVSGIYRVFVGPTYAATLKAQLMLATGNVQTLVLDGAASPVSTAVPSQRAFLNFTLAAPGNVGVGITDLALLGGSGNYVSIVAYNEAGQQQASSNCYVSEVGCKLNLRNFPAGNHRIEVSPSGSAQRMSFNALLSSEVTGTLVRDVAMPLGITRRGQNARLSFTGTAGERLTLQVMEQTTLPAWQTVYYTVLNPDGTTLTSMSPNTVGTLELPPLPVAGTYSVFVSPAYAATLKAQFMLASGYVQTLALDGAATRVLTPLPGQRALLNFTLAAPGNVGIAITDLALLGGLNSYVSIAVYNEAGYQQTSLTCYVSAVGCKLNIDGVPGNYRVAVSPADSVQRMSFNALLSSEVTGTLVRDVAMPLEIARRGQNARLSFAGTEGDRLALQVIAQTTLPAWQTTYYKVLKPDGTTLTSMSLKSPGTLELPRLPVSGAYSIFVESDYAATLKAQLMLVTGNVHTLVLDGAASPVSTVVPNQRVFLNFTLAAPGSVGVGITDLALLGGTGSYVNIVAYDEAGQQRRSSSCYVSNVGCKLNLRGLPAGNYRVEVSPSDSAQRMSFNALLSSEITGALKRDVAIPLEIMRRGQNINLSFAGVAGERLTLRVMEQATLPIWQEVYYYVLRPDGATLTSMSPNSVGTLELPPLPVSGNYSVFVSPAYAATLKAQLMLASGSVHTLALDGATTRVSTPLPNQRVFLNFTLAAPGNVGVGITDLALLGGAGSYVNIVAYNEAGQQRGSSSCRISEVGCKLNLRGLPAGNYRVEVSPSDSAQRMSFNALLSSEITGTLTRDVAMPLEIARRGQNANLSFAGTEGERLTLRVMEQITLPAWQQVYYYVLNPDGTTLTSISFDSSRTLNLPPLPASGTYSIFVGPRYAATLKAQLMLARGNVHTLVLDGAATRVSTPLPGQRAFLNFTLAAPGNVGIGIADLALLGGVGSYVNINVYDKDGRSRASANCYVNQGCGLSLKGLAAGNYRVEAYSPDGAQRMSFDALLSSEVTGALTRDVAMPLTIARRGQNARLSFTGAAGERFELRVMAQTTSPAWRTVYYTVFRPDGTTLASISLDSQGKLNLPALPVAGTYSVFVGPAYAATITSQLMLASTTP
ncbi:glutamate synthase [Solilutibacter pythonis]|nr:glutamate synthase [Lysobacter pythonis]